MSNPAAIIAPTSTQRRWRAWIGLVLGLGICLALLVWAGAGAGPRRALPWDWSTSGWLIPAPGMTWLWLTAAITFWLLSTLAWLLFTTPPDATKLNPWASAALIFLLSAALHFIIARTWAPLGKAFVGSPLIPRHWLIAADLAAIAALLFVLYSQQRSLWWAALYAWHPLVLIEVAAHGASVAILAPVLVILAAAAGKIRWLIVPLILGLLSLGVWSLAPTTAPSLHGFAWEFFRNFACRGNEAQTTQGAIALLAILELAIVLLSLRRHWPLAITLGHMAVIYLLCSPSTFPAQILLPLILLSLAWNRALWIASLSSLSAYAAILMQRNGHGFTLPDWLLVVAWMPVAVVEAHTLFVEAWRGFRPSSLRVSAAPR